MAKYQPSDSLWSREMRLAFFSSRGGANHGVCPPTRRLGGSKPHAILMAGWRPWNKMLLSGLSCRICDQRASRPPVPTVNWRLFFPSAAADVLPSENCNVTIHILSRCVAIRELQRYDSCFVVSRSEMHGARQNRKVGKFPEIQRYDSLFAVFPKENVRNTPNRNVGYFLNKNKLISF